MERFHCTLSFQPFTDPCTEQAHPLPPFCHPCFQAFPCIATGIYGYPNEKAAHIALETTKEWLMEHKDEVCVSCVILVSQYVSKS